MASLCSEHDRETTNGRQDYTILPLKPNVTSDLSLANRYYEIKTSLGKGLGLFASRHIRRGERIMSEEPLLVVRGFYCKTDVEIAFSKLSEEVQGHFLSLHSAHGIHDSWSDVSPDCAAAARERSVYSIYQTNCTEMGQASAVFKDGSRMNHSCVPNAVFYWNGNIKHQTVHALIDIKAGDEITVAYCDLSQSMAERARVLRTYGFKCICASCEDPSGLSDARRRRMSDLEYFLALKKESSGAATSNDRRDPLDAFLELEYLLKKEGLFDLQLARVYRRISQLYDTLGRTALALDAARDMLAICLTNLGPDHPKVKKARWHVRQLNDKLLAAK